MKKIAIFTSVILIALTFMACENTAPKKSDEYVLWGSGLVMGDGSMQLKNFSNDIYKFQTRWLLSDEEKYLNLPNTNITMYGRTYDMKYVSTQVLTPNYCWNRYEYRTGDHDRGSILAWLLKGTNQLLGMHINGKDCYLVKSETELKTEDEFIEYARKVASEFKNIDEFICTVKYYDTAYIHSATGHPGDTYTFTRYIDNIPTQDQVSVKITPNGLVKQIMQFALDDYNSFLDFKLDREKLNALLDTEVKKMIRSADLELKDYETEYGLSLDGNSMLLSIHVDARVLPQASTSDKNEFENLSIFFIVPVLEKK